MKVVLDSNVVIAAFATRGLCSDVFELCLYEHSIVLSRFLLEEIHRSLCKKVRLPQSLADNIGQFLASGVEIVTPARVPKDAQLTHEAAIGKIRNEELNYLMTRGFSKDEATSLVAHGFISLDIPGLPPTVNKYIKEVIELTTKKSI